jgi:integrase
MQLIKFTPVQTPGRWEDALGEYLLLKQADGAAERTLYDYRRFVGRFFKAFPDAWGDYHTLREAVLRYFAGLRDKSPAYFNNTLKYLRCFFGWCVEEGYLPADPTKGVSKRREEGRARNIPAEVLKRLLALPDRTTYTGTRDYALILLQLDTGIRPGEALGLLPAHFNLQALEVTIPQVVAKTRTSRIAVYGLETAKAIRRLLKARLPDWDASVPVFASQDGRPMLETSWAHRLRKYSRKVGCRITPYDLRHSAAIMFLRGEGNVFALQRMLGHSDLQMTRRYLALTQDDLRREHAKASPVGQLIPRRSRVRKVGRRD